MNIAVVDDEFIYLQKIKDIMIRNFPHFIVDQFSNTKDLLESEVIYDILLLDIEMPNEDGISFAKKHLKNYQSIIFISSHSERIFDAFYSNVMGFVPKDKMEYMLVPKINELITVISNNKYLQLRTNDGEHKFIQSNILYFIYKDECIVATTSKGNFDLTITSLKKLKELLDESFLFINRNVIINLNHIHTFQKHTHDIKMINDQIFTVSVRNWSILLHEYNQRIYIL